MTIQEGSILLGIAAEATEGTPVAAPQYVFGAEDGGVIPVVSDEPDDLTSSQNCSSSVFRKEAAADGDMVVRANLASIGMLLWGTLGDKAVTGASAPYTHVFTNSIVKPSFTLFEIIPDGVGLDVPRADGVKVDELTFEWEGNNPVKVSAKCKGRALSFGASGTASIASEVGVSTNFIPAGGTFKIDVDSATPVAAKIKGGSITLGNSLTQQFYSGVLTPGAVDPGWHVAECAFTVVPDDIDIVRTVLTGSASGAGIAVAPVYGSFEHVFKSQGGDAGHSLKFEGLKVAYMADLPKAKAGGGAAEVELAGKCMLPSGAGASPVKVTLINATAAYAAV